MEIKDIACGNVGWIQLAQDRIPCLAHGNTSFVRFEVVMAMIVNITVLWDATPYNLVDRYFHLQCTRVTVVLSRWKKYSTSLYGATSKEATTIFKLLVA
jgi:hypothetical protein